MINQEYLPIGLVPVSWSIPSFATPILLGEQSDLFFIQNSLDRKIIQDFLPVGKGQTTSNVFRPHRLNASLKLGDDFLIGFIDVDNSQYLMSYEDLHRRIDERFEKFESSPIFQWSSIVFFDKADWIKRLSFRAALRLDSAFKLRGRILAYNEILNIPSRRRNLEPTREEHIGVQSFRNIIAHKTDGRSLGKLSIAFQACLMTSVSDFEHDLANSIVKMESNEEDLQVLLYAYYCLQKYARMELRDLKSGSEVTAAYIEHRPRSVDKNAAVSHYVIMIGGEERHGAFKTQHEAKDRACAEGYNPVHVARVRHLQDHNNPDHFRKDSC